MDEGGYSSIGGFGITGMSYPVSKTGEVAEEEGAEGEQAEEDEGEEPSTG